MKKRSIKIAQWSILGLGLIFTILTMLYTDITITYRHGLVLLDCLFSGKIFEFYPVAAGSSVGAAGYAAPIYVVFGIWNIPTWIASRFLGVDELSAGCLLWTKLLPVLFGGGCIYKCVSVAEELIEEADKEELTFFCASSLFVFCPVIAVSQYDSIGLFFTLSGVLHFFRKKKLDAIGIALFAIAATMKFFALFVILFLFLLYEKSILRLIRNFVAILLPGVVVMLPFSASVSSAGALTGGMLSRLTHLRIRSAISEISVFFLFFFILCIVAYLSKEATGKELFEKWCWFCAAFWLVFFLFAQAFPYWSVLMFPYFAWICCERGRNNGILQMIETVMEGTMTLLFAFFCDRVYLYNGAFSHTLAKNTFLASGNRYDSFRELILGITSSVPDIVFASALLVAGGSLLFLNNPWKRFDNISYDARFFSIINARWIRVTLILGYVGGMVLINCL